MLSLAAYNGLLPVVQLLLDLDILRNSVYLHMTAGAGKKSALQWAETRGHVEVAAVLREAIAETKQQETYWASRSDPSLRWSASAGSVGASEDKEQ